MSSQISGVYVTVTAVGVVLVWSGWKGTTLSATFTSLLNGNLNAPASEITTTADTTPAGTTSPGSSTTVASSNANYLTIAKYLVSNGYSNAAAAGIVGCIAGESSGNPEAGAGTDHIGLIQWTGSNTADVPALTGNATTDLDAQLPAIIAYNNAQGENYIAMLNQITDPVQAADFYSQHFERPKITDSDVVPSVATSVYQQLTSGK